MLIESLFEAETGLDADDEQIEDFGKLALHLALSLLDLAIDLGVGTEQQDETAEPERRGPHEALQRQEEKDEGPKERDCHDGDHTYREEAVDGLCPTDTHRLELLAHALHVTAWRVPTAEASERLDERARARVAKRRREFGSHAC